MSRAVLLSLCAVASGSRSDGAQDPMLYVTGLPCPGGQGEPATAHPLLWQCRSANDQNQFRPWHNWQDTVPIDYGDIVSVTWFGQCRSHPEAWDFLRLDLVVANSDGTRQTNTTTIRMKPGYNFVVSYLYWYTNGDSLYPTNFDVGQVPVEIGVNQTPVLGAPVSLPGLDINPAIWQSGIGPITNPADWPAWGTPGQFPRWPLWTTNEDGAIVIPPEAQLPFFASTRVVDGVADLALEALPGAYTLQTKASLPDPWNDETNLVVGDCGATNAFLPLPGSNTLFLRLKGRSPSAGVGYLAEFETLGRRFEPTVACDPAPQELLWTWSDGTSSADYPVASRDFGSEDDRFQHLKVYPPGLLTAINLGFDGSDGGENTPLDAWPQQDVSAVHFPYPLTGLRYWASSYNPFGDTLDFSGFTSLEIIECFQCANLQHVFVANLPALRRACFESCNLQELDLTGNPSLEDLRAALNAYTNIVVGGGTGPRVWHWCTRDNPQLTRQFQDVITNFYDLQEFFVWNDNQSGALAFLSTHLTDVSAWDNFYSSADLTGQANLIFCSFRNNLLTNIVIDGCPALQSFDVAGNHLSTGLLDSLLATLDTSAPDLSFADLSLNDELPSPLGYAHYQSLTNRGATVLVDWPAGIITSPVLGLDSATLLAESCAPTNNAIDPGETVTVLFALTNRGAGDTTNLVVALLETNGVVSPSAPQPYGVVPAGGVASFPFTFTAAGSCGDAIAAVLQLQDGAQDLGTVSVSFELGTLVPFSTESFDSVTAPDLPPAWTTSTTGGQAPWVTTSSMADTPPNAVFSPDPPDPGVNELVSPQIALPTNQTLLSFRHSYDLELGEGTTADDGGVLEIQIGTNSFTDILDAGGTFLTNGYTGTITNIWGNPLAGRLAWSGDSGGFVTTLVQLPAAAAGQTIQLRWRCASDGGNPRDFAGWFLDTIAIGRYSCCPEE